MYACALEELAWAIAREREEEARRTRLHTEARREPRGVASLSAGASAAADEGA